jgi:hypothetical protein
MSVASELVGRVETIGTVPTSVAQIFGLINDSKATMSDFEKVVRPDAGFTANLLRSANSAFYRGAREITSVRDAITRMGMRRVFEVAASASFARTIPPVLKGYGNRAHADPARWWLARTDYDTLDRITGHFGQYYGRGVSVAAQNHNLRTVVIDAAGRVHEIFMGNEWTPAELVKSLTEAAGKR